MSYLDDHFNFEISGEITRETNEGDTAPKLVFLHGLMGSLSNWRSLVKHFSESYQVLTYDQRGHGRSFKPESGYAPSDFADDLHQIINDLGWDKINLVGHSMGARNALQFAALYPERVQSLVMEDMGPESVDKSVDRITGLITSVPTPFKNKQQAKDFFAGPFLEIHKENKQVATLAKFFYSNLDQAEGGSIDWRFSKEGILKTMEEGRGVDRWAEFTALSMPTMVMRGEYSNDLSREVFDKMQSVNRKAKAIEVKGVGHWIHFEKPKEFTQLLKTFLESSH